MSIDTAKRLAEIIPNSVPDKYKCSQLLSDFIKEFPSIFKVKIPSSSNVGFVATSQNAPDSSEASLWVELNGAGVPLGISYFIDGAWRKILNTLRSPQWINGNYLNDRDSLEAQGYVLMDGNNGTTDLTHLFKTINSVPKNYSVYAVAFLGRQILPNP